VATAFGVTAYAVLCFQALAAIEVVRRRVFETFQVGREGAREGRWVGGKEGRRLHKGRIK